MSSSNTSRVHGFLCYLCKQIHRRFPKRDWGKKQQSSAERQSSGLWKEGNQQVDKLCSHQKLALPKPDVYLCSSAFGNQLEKSLGFMHHDSTQVSNKMAMYYNHLQNNRNEYYGISPTSGHHIPMMEVRKPHCNTHIKSIKNKHSKGG